MRRCARNSVQLLHGFVLKLHWQGGSLSEVLVETSCSNMLEIGFPFRAFIRGSGGITIIDDEAGSSVDG